MSQERVHQGEPQPARDTSDLRSSAQPGRGRSRSATLASALGNQAMQALVAGGGFDTAHAEATSGGAVPPLADGPLGRLRPLVEGARIYSGPAARRAAELVRARAYVHGGDVVLGAGAGPRTVTHELIHVAQARALDAGTAPPRRLASPGDPAERQARDASAAPASRLDPTLASLAPSRPDTVYRDELPGETSLPETHEGVVDPDLGPASARDDDGEGDDTDPLAPAPHRADWTISGHDDEPIRIFVPGDVTRAEIAERIYEDESLAHDFDFVPSRLTGTVDGVQERAIEVRDPSRLAAWVMDFRRQRLERALSADVQWTHDQLLRSSPDEDALARMALRWSQRSSWRDASGTSYFDKYLDALSRRSITQTRTFIWEISRTTKSDLDWLLIWTGHRSELVRKAITLRSSSWTVGYEVRDELPGDTGQLRRGAVIGRFFWSEGNSSMQLLVAETLVESMDRDRALRVLRNSPWIGWRVLMPGKEGRWFGYGVIHPMLDPLVPGPRDDAEGDFFWYYPGTILVRAGQFEPDYSPLAGGHDEFHAEQIFFDLLQASSDSDPSPLYGLDYDVLSTLQVAERALIFGRVLASRGGDRNAIALMTRTLMSTPPDQFPALERRLSADGHLTRLLGLQTPALAELGNAFTMLSLASVPIGADAFGGMPSFTIGQGGYGTSFAMGEPTEIQSDVVAAADWGLTEAPQVTGAGRGREPAMEGEASGSIGRTAIRIRSGSYPSAYSMDTPRWQRRGENPPQVLLPTTLVRLDIVGPTPATRIVSAFELAMLTGNAEEQASSEDLGDFITTVNLILLMRAGIGLGRAFGPALAGGMARGGLRTALAAALAEGATVAGRAALRSAADAVLFTAVLAVEHNRQALTETGEGRTFLAVYDTAMAMLIVHSAYRLLSSGLLSTVVQRGRLALARLSGSARNLVRSGIDDMAAAVRAFEQMKAEGQMVAVTEHGMRVLRPADPSRFGLYFRRAQGEIAREAVVGAVRGEASLGASAAARVDSFFARLERAATTSKEHAQAYAAAARYARSLPPAEAVRFIDEAERVLGLQGALRNELIPFLKAAARSPTPLAYLGDVEWLVNYGASRDAIGELARKAARGKLDLGWLRTTNLSVDDLNFLARDSNTSWRLFQRAARTGKLNDVIWARARARGAATEMLAEEQAGALFAGERITGRQVAIPGAVADLELTGALGARRAAEVKGWTVDVWQRAIGAYEARAAGTATAAELRAVDKLDHLVGQLRAMQAAYGRAPYLVRTAAMPRDLVIRLKRILRRELGFNVPMRSISEAAILARGRRMRTAMGVR